MSIVKTITEAAERLYISISRAKLVYSLRQSLVTLIPVLLLGSFALVVQSFPLPSYQEWLTSSIGEYIYNLSDFAQNATTGLLGVYLTITLSSYYKETKTAVRSKYGLPLTCVVAFCVFSGIDPSSLSNLSNLGVNGVFTAIISTLLASDIYARIVKNKRVSTRMRASEFDATFREMAISVYPIIVTSLVIVLIELVIVSATGLCFQNLFSSLFVSLFSNIGATLPGMVSFVLVEHILWFFGIHGGNVLNPVKDSVFIDALNQSSTMFNSSFLDAFVLMGGCGAALALVIALLLFSKRRGTRDLALYSGLPVLFNINELVIFSLPIVFNPIFIIPFLAVPLVNILVATVACGTGLVPFPTTALSWTTPVLLGGYVATGSVAGSILQLVNIAIDVLIYMPFVKLYDRVGMAEFKQAMEEIVGILKESEESRQEVRLLELDGSQHAVVTTLADQIDYIAETGSATMYYQPQYGANGQPVGAESLFRMSSPAYGMIYPPLVFQIAEETKVLGKLEQAVLSAVVRDMPELKRLFGDSCKISVNVTGYTIQTSAYEQFLVQLAQEHPEHVGNIDIEITEQASFNITPEFIERLSRIKGLGFDLVIDDFSMGNTSIKYLQSDLFSIVKLDGGISKDILDNDRSQKIVSMISELTRSLNIRVLAEYVETEEQRELLESLGCALYQGYLYSPAVPLDELDSKLQSVAAREK